MVKIFILAFLTLLLVSCMGQSVKRSSGGVVTAKSVYSASVRHIIKFPVIYPELALERKITGNVRASFQVSEGGKAFNITIVESSSELLDSAAFRCLEKNLFAPSKTTEEQEVVYEVNFIFGQDHLNQKRSKIGVSIAE